MLIDWYYYLLDLLIKLKLFLKREKGFNVKIYAENFKMSVKLGWFW